MKYLVIADTYRYAYGCEYTLFGVFDTKEEAVRFILDYVPADDCDQFDFFAGYEETRTVYFDPKTGDTRRAFMRRRGDEERFTEKKILPITKEEYAFHFIHEFDGNPMYIGGYQE